MKNTNDIRIIEINGIKLEVDLRTARRIDQFKIGDNVKVLRGSGSSMEVLAGVIIEFVNFKELPTIQVAVFKSDYWGTKIEFLNINSKTEGIEIVGVSQHELVLEKARVIDKMNDEITKKKNELDEIVNKKEYFLKHFAKYFKDEDNG